jgi:galactokinase/mevalonate kinase-like predicted kinase
MIIASSPYRKSLFAGAKVLGSGGGGFIFVIAHKKFQKKL